MSSIEKTKRTSLTWNPEFKETVSDLKDILKVKTGQASFSNLEIFMLCMAYGFEQQKKNPTPPRASDVVNVTYVKDLDLAEMRAIAMTETAGVEVLNSEDEVFNIAEQYASGGLELLAKRIQSEPDFGGWLAKNVWKRLNALESKNN